MIKKSVTFTAADLLRRAQEKYEDPKNNFCHDDYDAALDDALLGMKQELDEMREDIDDILQNDPEAFSTPDDPDWDRLVRKVTEEKA